MTETTELPRSHRSPGSHGRRPTGRPGILLDRDGTIIVDHGYVGSIDRVELIPGAAGAIAAFNRSGIPVAVLSNQSGVARGLFGLEDVEKVNRHVADLLAEHDAHVDLFLYCPYHPDGTVQAFARTSADRKPGLGMAEAAAETLGLDLTASWVVGDRPEDMDLATAIGASAVNVGPETTSRRGAWSFASLGAAADFILERIEFRDEFRRDPRVAPGPEGGDSTWAGRKFPSEPFASAEAYCTAYLDESEKAWRSVDPSHFERAARLLSSAYSGGATVFSCGNGGSASVANHLQCDHSKGIRTSTDLSPRVVSLVSNVELTTAIANDLGYENVFVYQLQSVAKRGDVLIVISSSGRSDNIVRALQWAQEHAVHSIALTGFAGGPARELAEVSIHVDSMNYGIVEDVHQGVMHALAQYIRQSRMDTDQVAKSPF